MLHTIQSSIMDFLHSLDFRVLDDYPIRLARLYIDSRLEKTEDEFEKAMKGISTVIFRNNSADRNDVETLLRKHLDRRHLDQLDTQADFEEEIAREREALDQIDVSSAHDYVDAFIRIVEAQAIFSFWDVKGKTILKPKPESIAQGLFGGIMKALLKGNGWVVRECVTGIGRIDGLLFLNGTDSPHGVEIKIIEGELEGIKQLEEYMRIEEFSEGTLLAFDARKPDSKTKFPEIIKSDYGTIYVKQIDINPIAPSKKD